MTKENIATRTSDKKQGKLHEKDAHHVASQDSLKEIAEKNEEE